MTEKKVHSGINDPWRLYSKDRKKEHSDKATPVGAPGSIHPLDTDLLPQKQYVFRHVKSTGDLLIQGADNAKDAAVLLLSVIHYVPAFKTALEGRGFIYGPIKSLKLKGFVIKAGDYALCLPSTKSIAKGLSQLVITIKHCVVNEQLKKAGIIPLVK